jgi:EcsC protein family
VGRVSELSGEPITQALGRLPRPITRRINGVVRVTLEKALDLALYNLDSSLTEPGLSGFKVLSGIAGGVSGFFGLTTLPLELPITTMLMLRSIANIARRYGEDLTQPATRLACLEVLALGSTRGNANRVTLAEASYYAIRTYLARTVSQAAQAFAERGVTQSSAPIVVELL